MSTTFNIIPVKVDNSLTFQNVLSLAKHTLENQLTQLSINISIDFSVNLRHHKEQYVKQINPDTKFIWPNDEYAWFAAHQSTGGTDAYCRKLLDTLANWETYIEDNLDAVKVVPNLKQQIMSCEYEWYFRRSAGQAPLINLAYGHLAAAVAKLTNGYIYSNDGAWNHDIFPVTAEELLKVYFYPDKATDFADYDLVTRSIDNLRAEFP